MAQQQIGKLSQQSQVEIMLPIANFVMLGDASLKQSYEAKFNQM